MKLPRREFLHLAAGAAALPAISRIARAQTYPTRPITMVVTYPAGSAMDTAGRIVAERMRLSLGQPVIIENISGANGSIGVGRVARAAGDGYILVIGTWNTHVANGAVYPLTYDLLADFEPISLLLKNSYLIVARKAMPANDLPGLIAWLKANPNMATEGTSGAGSAQHVGGLLFQKLTGTRFRFVPYRSSSQAMQDLVPGRIDWLIVVPTDAMPASQPRRISRLWTRRDCLDFTFRTGAGFGRRSGRRRRLSSPNSMPRSSTLWPTRPCVSASRKWGRRFSRASSRRRKCSALSRKPRSKNGGRSSRWPE
jgi:tripartite-type tricarboxylate transporter receptor subunit TctC